MHWNLILQLSLTMLLLERVIRIWWIQVGSAMQRGDGDFLWAKIKCCGRIWNILKPSSLLSKKYFTPWKIKTMFSNIINNFIVWFQVLEKDTHRLGYHLWICSYTCIIYTTDLMFSSTLLRLKEFDSTKSSSRQF